MSEGGLPNINELSQEDLLELNEILKGELYSFRGSEKRKGVNNGKKGFRGCGGCHPHHS